MRHYLGCYYFFVFFHKLRIGVTAKRWFPTALSLERFHKHLLCSQSFKRLHLLHPLSSSPATIKRLLLQPVSKRSLSSSATGSDEWNDAWESAWLPDDLSAKHRAPWETDVNFPSPTPDLDDDTKAFVADMDERWTERRATKTRRPEDHQQQQKQQQKVAADQGSSRKAGDEYRMRKQRIHASLWTKEIEKMEESRLGGPGAAHDIDRLIDSCSEIFDDGNVDSKIPSTTEFKTKPDGWETTSKTQEGSIWEISQREEDILLQEFERRIAFSKFQIASFLKTHIFSRRRPIDGWKYMIEEIGPNARKGKGSVQRLPSLADPATQPFREERTAISPNLASSKRR